MTIDHSITTAEAAASKTTQYCSKCQGVLTGQFVRALDGTYHMECFTCMDCDTVVAQRFFPIDGPNGRQQPLCERDYFRRLNLVCEDCGQALRGSYITALDKKYHIEHFTCSVCPTVFGSDDSYYEHDGKVYCHYHYSLDYAVKCAGCNTAILKQFVEINRNSVDEHWHPECYMINKFWNVKLSQPFGNEDPSQPPQLDVPIEPDYSGMTADGLKEHQYLMEEKVYQIWTVLSAYEESSAACISDMLLHVSNGAYIDGVKMAERFIMHVEVLFTAIDDLDVQLKEHNDAGLHNAREAKLLCKKIIHFFSLLSHTQETGVRRLGITQELLSLVTGLAHYMKILIRIALTGALKLERLYGNKQAIQRFLNKLMDLANRDRQGRYRQLVVDPEVTSDLCHACRVTVEEMCVKSDGQYRWHINCLICSRCAKPLKDSYNTAKIDPVTAATYCIDCAKGKDGLKADFEFVSQLEQYTFLLRVALRRLYNLLKVPDDGHSNSGFTRGRSRSGKGTADLRLEDNTPPGLLRRDSRSKSYTVGDKAYDTINLGDIKRMKSIHMDRKLSNSFRFAKRSHLVANPGVESAHLLEKRNHDDSSMQSDDVPDSTIADSSLAGVTSAISLADISQIVAIAQAESLRRPVRITPDSKEYLSELSALEYFIVKHIAVLCMEDLLKGHFTLEELLDLIDPKKPTLWGKFVKSLKTDKEKKHRVKAEGTFSVPLEALVEKNGVESNLGAGPSRIRIPSFVDDSISAMLQMDMTVEGVFRKNGNIRRLKDLSEMIDRNPSGVNLADENPVQVAALLKKFLRDMPDPLLTFKLHRLFVTTQKLESESTRKKVLHFACCLLPKVNRDTMEVIFIFLKWVASFSQLEDDQGSKMDLMNLATVITPNILYSKGKDPTKDESFMAIEAVHMLLKYGEEFCAVPEELAPMIQDQSMLENVGDLTSRDIVRKYESLIKLKKSHSSGDIQSDSNNRMPPPSISSVVTGHSSQSLMISAEAPASL